MNEKHKKFVEQFDGEKIKFDEPMSNWTTFRIGGSADIFFEADTTEELIKAVKICRELQIPFFILGGGSNLLVSDKGIRGVVIRIANRHLAFSNQVIRAEAGITLSEVVEKAAGLSLTGLEFAVGIPGTLGGAVVGNAGAWQQSISDRLIKVRILTIEGEDKWLDKEECRFDYRNSRFKDSREIVLEAQIKLSLGNEDEIRKIMSEYLEKRSHQPKGSSAGCVFVNPKPLAAGALIEECALKGTTCGGAEISPLHGNFIVNKSGANCNDVLQLIALVKNKVKEKHNINLKEEIKLVGDF